MIEQRPAKATVPGFSLNVRVREVEEGGTDCSGGKISPSTTGERWVVRVLVLAIVLAVAGIYTATHIGRGWVPADDGTLGQSALRVMQGQLPHRDFGEIYTGGLSFIHALAFRAFGVNLMSLRICVFLFFLAWIPTVYYIALRFTSAIGAGAVTLLAIAWSYPNYPAAMPSWYNLFFATSGAAALLRYLEARKRGWLFVAGICGGISILVKVIGAYYIAGALLFFAFLEQSDSGVSVPSSPEIPEGRTAANSWLYRAFSVGALLLFLTTLVKVLHTRVGIPELYQFVLPSTAIVALILLGEPNVRAGTGQRFKVLFNSVVPFLAGVASPIILFLIPYARSAGVWRFLFGVTSSAVSRSVDLSVIRPVGVEKIIYLLPLLGVLAGAMFWDKFQGKLIGAALGLGAIVLAVRATQIFEILSGVWYSAAVLTPIAVVAGAALVWARRNSRGKATTERSQVMLLVSLAATCTLVQFPFAAPIYLSYALPLTILAVVAIVCTGKTQPGTYALASVVVFYLAFGVSSLVPHYIYELTHVVGHMDTMQAPRSGGLKIEGAAFFDDFSRFLHEHSPNGLMFAGNDCPELYFLSGLKNVTRDDGGAGPQEILKAAQMEDLNLIVINDAPFFPGARISPEVRAEVARLFPHKAQFGIFEVFWKR